MAQPDMSDHPESRHLLDFVARLGETDEGGLFRHLLSCPACSKVALELIENQRRGLDWGNVLSFHPVVDRAASRLETVWRERDSYLLTVPGFVEFHLLKGPVRDDHVLYSSHTTWRTKDDFEAWTKSEAFRAAHARAGQVQQFGDPYGG